ncbi:FAD-binding oxidoreductase [Nocardia sp. alder85J]|uniref:FAD-binding oxidoreductase n=1 Tax=Nocardia sp. alder85J TaxID=2862949 RepID=UPI001CD5ED83|nr:FAD-binding oxidoreductase [Nocardia sp. alder85J]MCX4094357.1 FAD-binding oxidoreductase [Nocardia sp. alder85J]
MLARDEDYAAAKEIFNTRYDAEAPAAVVQVTSTQDVAAAMAFAAENNLRVAARSGGHSYLGVSAATGVLIIDLRRLRNVSYLDGAAVVEPGLTLYDMYGALDRFGQMIPTGMCPMVGVAGLTLGGGLGFESRRYGMTCDRLTAATVVLPDGRIAEVSKTSYPDLLWALRGGGHFLGIVTSFTYATCPAAPKDLVEVTFPGNQVARAVAGWQSWITSAERGQWADISIDADGEGGLRCWVQLVCPAGTGATATAGLTEAVGLAPLTVESRTLSHMDTVTYLAGGGGTEPRSGFANGSDVVTELTPEVIMVIIEAITMFSRAGHTGWVQINTLDGAVRDTTPDLAAFPWRHHAALVEWGAYDPNPADASRDWIANAHRLIEPASAGAYVNYLEPGDRIDRYFGHNYQRFHDIRARIDPDRRIHTPLIG